MATNIRHLKLESPAFGHHGEIPARHSGEGEDLAPEMRWSGVPAGTRQLALVCHDPDAPLPEGFTHWLVYGIPPDAGGFPRGAGASPRGGNEEGELTAAAAADTARRRRGPPRSRPLRHGGSPSGRRR
jgi:Raf kinase inhibitor-like YbhB/YbcL family protein